MTIDKKLVNLASNLTGMSEEAAHEILRDVKANHKLLDECVGPHDFQRVDGTMPMKFRCSKCGGTVSASLAMWYKKGLQHGRVLA